jgi:hypothetical protein
MYIHKLFSFSSTNYIVPTTNYLSVFCNHTQHKRRPFDCTIIIMLCYSQLGYHKTPAIHYSRVDYKWKKKCKHTPNLCTNSGEGSQFRNNKYEEKNSSITLASLQSLVDRLIFYLGKGLPLLPGSNMQCHLLFSKKQPARGSHD